MTASFLIFALVTQAEGPTLAERFRTDWRAKAIETVERHLETHADCDLKDTVPTLEKMQILFSKPLDSLTRAVALPSVEQQWPIAFFNPTRDWTEADAVLTLIHEATHLTRRNNRWLCGPDADMPTMRDARRVNPPCRLFGKTQFNSMQIDAALKAHLGL